MLVASWFFSLKRAPLCCPSGPTRWWSRAAAGRTSRRCHRPGFCGCGCRRGLRTRRARAAAVRAGSRARARAIVVRSIDGVEVLRQGRDSICTLPQAEAERLGSCHRIDVRHDATNGPAIVPSYSVDPARARRTTDRALLPSSADYEMCPRGRVCASRAARDLHPAGAVIRGGRRRRDRIHTIPRCSQPPKLPP